jgi:carbon storage regulator CsrA
MLVLTRSMKSPAIIIGDTLRVNVLAITPNHVRIAIDDTLSPQGGVLAGGVVQYVVREGANIELYGDITIKVLRLTPHQVRFGIDAPLGVDIYREELYNKIKAGQQLLEAKTPTVIIDAPVSTPAKQPTITYKGTR